MSKEKPSFAESFRRVIDIADPMANSLMSKDNPPSVKILADWGRKACDELAVYREEIPKSYREGFDAGLRLYAWWKDGVQYVGTCGTKLSDALKEIPEKT